MFRAYFYAFVSILLLSVVCTDSALAQFDTEYWMPPVWEPRDDGPPRGPGDPVGSGGQTRPTELVVTTAYPNVEVRLLRANGTPQGELLGVQTVQPGDPAFFRLSNLGETDPPRGMTYQANVIENNKGLRIIATAPVQVVYRNISSNNQCLSPLKGRFALGREFLAGTQTRVTNNKYGKDDIHFVSVMATEDNTVVTLTAPGPYFAADGGPQTSVTRTLNKDETYLVRNNNVANLNDGPDPVSLADDYYVGNNFDANLAGTRISADKPVAVMTGGQHLRYDDGDLNPDEEVDADAGIDQAVPIESDIFDMIGTEYIIVRGGNQLGRATDTDGNLINEPTDETDYAIIIATEDDTEIYVNGGATPEATIAEGEFYNYVIPGGTDALGTPYYIRTSKKAYLYHVSGLRKQELGMSAVPTIECAGSQYIAFNRFDNPNPGVTVDDPRSYDNTIHVIGKAEAFNTLIINNQSYLDYLSVPNRQFRGERSINGPGGEEWRTATFNFPKDDPNNLIIRSEGFFHVGVVVGGNEGGTYGYLSSFARKVDVLDPSLLPIRIPTPLYRVGTVIPGDTLTHCLELASCDPDHTIETITPSANTGDAFRQGEEGTSEDICLRYVAKPDYLGNDTITVLVRNGQGIPGQVQLVFEVAQFPQAVDDTVAVGQGGTVDGNVLTNDRNVEAGDFAEVVTDVQNGTAALNSDGTFTYTPEPRLRRD